MEARVVTPGDLTGRDVAAWEECAANALEPNPFLEPGWLLPALRHLDEAPQAALILAEHAGAVHACLPVFEAAPGTGGPDPASSRSVLNTRVAHTAVPVGTPLVAADRAAEAVECLIGAVGRLVATRRSQLVVLEWMVTDGPEAALIREAATRRAVRLVEFEAWERGFLRRAADEEYWLRAIGKNHRRTIRQHRRHLEELLGAEVPVRVTTEPAAVEAFLRLEMAGWKGHDPAGLALGRRRGPADFFRAACRSFLERGRMDFLCLDGPGGPVAMICCVRAGEGLFTFRTAYDERMARFGPGVILLLAAMEYFDHDTDAAWLDSCAAPGNDHLLGYFPDRRCMATLMARVHTAG